jgi:hypothetical protein
LEIEEMLAGFQVVDIERADNFLSLDQVCAPVPGAAEDTEASRTIAAPALTEAAAVAPTEPRAKIMKSRRSSPPFGPFSMPSLLSEKLRKRQLIR